MNQKLKRYIQEPFLFACRKDKIPVTVITTKGFQIRGLIKRYDDYSIELAVDQENQQLIFKSAISTIVPKTAINFEVEPEPAKKVKQRKQQPRQAKEVINNS